MLKKAIYLFFLLLCFPTYASSPVKCGSEWINIHKKNPNLIGIVVQQYPDNSYDAQFYKDKHPSVVIYIFKSKKAHQIEYSPSGQIQNGFWWGIPEGHDIYQRMQTDFKEDVFCAYYVDNEDYKQE